MADELGKIVHQLLQLGPDSDEARPIWAKLGPMLDKRNVPQPRANRIVHKRDINDLTMLLGELAMGMDEQNSGPTQPPGVPARPPMMPAQTQPTDQAPDPNDPPIDRALLRHAMKTFRKRLKLTHLDEVSKLGVGPMSAGKRSNIAAIQPPAGFEARVWEQLAREGRLLKMGRGFYAIPESG